MQQVTIKKNSEDTTMRFEDVFNGQYFEWDEHLYIKLGNVEIDRVYINAYNITDKIPVVFNDEDKVKLVSEINIEYTL